MKETLGVGVYGFRLADRDGGNEGPPRSMSALTERLEELGYINEIQASGHCLQVCTDDDEIEPAHFFLDDHFLAKHPGRATPPQVHRSATSFPPRRRRRPGDRSSF